MGNKKQNFARFGVATKGWVYFLIGGLTAFAAFGLGGEKSGSSNALDFISQQMFGKILLIITAVGLVGYVFWRWYQAFADPKDAGTDFKAIVKRVSYFISGVFYSFLAFSAIKQVLGSSSGGGEDSFLMKILDSKIIAIIIGLALLGKSIYEFYQAYSGNFREEVDEAGLSKKAKKIIIPAAKIGFTARGIVVGIMAFLMLRAAVSASAEKVDKTQAFGFLQNEFGSLVMGIIAVGLIAYGVFMLIKAKYSSLSVD
tara:strand:+ start:6090 stop:6857 length:768 start_codon:yes stop_codon:yes gene_type:complete